MKVTEKLLFSLPVVVALCGGVWSASSLNSDVQVMKGQMAEVRADVKILLNRTPAVAGPTCPKIGPFSLRRSSAKHKEI